MKTYTVKIDDHGTKRWLFKGKLHNEDGPAEEFANGTKCWFINDQLHNENGPAIVLNNGLKRWFLSGVEYTKKQFDEIITIKKEKHGN
jgi:hypothetical protein